MFYHSFNNAEVGQDWILTSVSAVTVELAEFKGPGEEVESVSCETGDRT